VVLVLPVLEAMLEVGRIEDWELSGSLFGGASLADCWQCFHVS
jgi:hypothetical protein